MAQTNRSSTEGSVLAGSAAVIATCIAFLAGGAFVSVLQGCHQLKGGTSSAGETNTASSPAQGDSTQLQVAGCWKLSLQATGPQRDSLRAWFPRGSLPSVVELDTARAEPASRDTIYKAYSWFDGRRETRPFSIWRPMGPDSIRVERARALSGTMMDLAVADGKLTGDVIVYGDAGMIGKPTRRKGPLEATPTQCPDK